MKEYPQQSRSGKALALLFANGINLAINFLTMPYLARSLGYEEYGSYGQLFLIGTIFTAIFSLGAVHVLNMLYAENEGSEERVFSSTFWLFVISGFAALTVIALSRGQLARVMQNAALGDLLLVYMPSIFFGMLGSISTTTIVYFGRVRELAFAAVTTNVIRVAFLVAAITFVQSLSLAMVGLSISTFIQAVWYALLIPVRVRRFSIFDRRLVQNQLLLGFPLMLSSLIFSGMLNADGVLVSTLMSVTDYAKYRAGAIEIPFISTIWQTFTTILMPDFARLAVAGKGAEMFDLNRRSSSIAAVVVIPVTVLFIFFGKEFIIFLLSEKYAESGVIFSIISINVLFRITQYSSIPLAYRRTKSLLLGNAIGVAVNLVLGIVLITSIGFEGAAVGRVVGTLAMIAYFILLSCYLTKQSISGYFDWRFLFGLICTCLIWMTGTRLLYNAFSYYWVLGACVLGYILVVFVFLRIIRPDILRQLTDRFVMRVRNAMGGAN